ncbi:metallophosphoesterase family protein [Haliangium sp.]|uniref:metallophosphoesterase family protein n=1 Tax=Haliangium sp. TaxID=2663208 RepID=UPI003D14AE2E
MKLYAISDIHIGHPENREAFAELPAHPDDWLILAGDIGETARHLAYALNVVKDRFAQVLWVPGNHDLWTVPQRERIRGETKYQALVEICQHFGVLTPEDPYPIWSGPGGDRLICPLFLLYDYTFCPDGMSPAQALAWAKASDIECVDEHLLHPDPYPSRQAWCHARCDLTEQRLERAVAEHDCPLVLINHFPLRQELAVLPRVPRFTIWCGTRRTEDWHTRFRAEAVVFGHLHIRQTRHIDGVRFEEVSLGYPRQWQHAPIGDHLRQILPNR